MYICTILGLTFADAKNSMHGTLISIGYSTKKVFSFRLANTSKVSNRVVEMPTYCNRDSIYVLSSDKFCQMTNDKICHLTKFVI